MPRESFHWELDRLVEKVVELGREVESCLDTMVGALERVGSKLPFFWWCRFQRLYGLWWG